MIKNKEGYILPYCLFLMVLVLNMFIFVVLCNLNTKNYFHDKINYSHVFILEERAKKNIKQKINENRVENYETETIYYDTDFIYFIYIFDETTQIWSISITIKHENIYQYATIFYNKITEELVFKTR